MAVATAAAMTVAILHLAALLIGPEAGLMGLLQIGAAHLSIAAMALAPVALLRDARAAKVAFAGLIVVTAARFGDEWTSFGVGGRDAPSFEVLTWNLQLGARGAEGTVAMLADNPADLVALQELQPAAAAAIESDAGLSARYPYRALVPRSDVGGMGILSTVPLRDATFRTGPVVQEAIVTLGGRDIRVVNAHPFPAAIQRLPVGGLPFGIDPTDRNAGLAQIRSTVDARIVGGETVLLIGDFNTAPSEPAYGRLTDGLVDVHRAVGVGPGWTWRPARFAPLGIGLLRIDLVLLGPGLAPGSIGVTCPPQGDHCLVRARLVPI